MDPAEAGSLPAPDFGHLEPMVDATQRELAAAGVTETPGVLLADAGYWHHQQMEQVIDRGIQAPASRVALVHPRF